MEETKKHCLNERTEKKKKTQTEKELNKTEITNSSDVEFETLVIRIKDGSELGGSRVHFPLCTGGTLSHSSEEQSEQPRASQRI